MHDFFLMQCFQSFYGSEVNFSLVSCELLEQPFLHKLDFDFNKLHSVYYLSFKSIFINLVAAPHCTLYLLLILNKFVIVNYFRVTATYLSDVPVGSSTTIFIFNEWNACLK